MTERSADVVIVGAGPTGLLLAGDLAAAGVRTTILERRTSGSSLSRAFAVHARTLELLDARGLADELVRGAERVDRLRLFGQVEVDLSRLPTRFPFVLITPQYRTEGVLERRARSLGVQIVTGEEVTGVRQTGDEDGEVEVQSRGPGGERHAWRAQFVVGADGVHSAVRTSLGVPFPGTSVLRSVMLADVRLDRPPPDVPTLDATSEGVAFIVPFGDGWYRVIAWDRHHQVPDDHPVGLTELRDVTARVLGTDLGIGESRWLSRFHNDERQVPRYRVGRVLLAGDAAHVHSPAGGQGMNTGLQDAANLGWKLARRIRSGAADRLLDTYHDERHPVGRMVLRLSGSILRMALLHGPGVVTVRNRAAGALTRLAPVNRGVALAVSGLAVRYPAEPGAGPHAGRRAPDFRLSSPDPARLYEALRQGRFVLLTQDARLTLPAEDVSSVRPVGDGPDWMLVRPDGYVAASSTNPDPGESDSALRDALRRWLPDVQPAPAGDRR
jgi:2-polyprenyl-6-methoxyphenol hydroxylase-like FAD-dependent oxidoreductase